MCGVDIFQFEQYQTLNYLIDNKSFSLYNRDVVVLSDYVDLVDDADVIIPLAALVGQHICDKLAGEARKVNVDSVRDLVDHVKGTKKLILFPNTNSGYGTTDGDSLCTEETPMNPISTYGITKCEAEQIVLEHEHSYVFRLATVCGVSPRMRLDLFVNDLVFRAHFNIVTEIYEPTYMRNFVHVNDVCRAFIWAIDAHHNLTDRVFNLGNDTINMSKWDLVQKVKEYYPDWEVSINDNQKDIDQRNYIVSSKLLEFNGFKAIIDLDDTIKQLRTFFNTAEYGSDLNGMNNKVE